MKVRCSECSHEVAPGTLGRCPVCGGILQPIYEDASIRGLAQVEPGPGMDHYRAVMPASSPIPFLGEGDTPLLASRRLGPELGLDNLSVKVEGRSPSGSFKDRPAALAAALARDEGKQGIVTAAASGNAASAIATYAAAAGLQCVILAMAPSPPGNTRQALAMGARVLPVEGLFRQEPDEIVELLTRVTDESNHYLAFVWAPVNPYILEGIKTISYEVVARLPGPPDVVVCPVGGGDMLAAQWRGYKELQRAGVIDRLPRMVGVQAKGASPLLAGFRQGLERVPALPQASSKLPGINVRFTGDHALRAVRESGGRVAAVSDEEAFAMQRKLGTEEGLWVGPESGVTLAALPGLLERAQIAKDERAVCILSAAGYKDPHVAEDSTMRDSEQAPLPFDAEAILDKINN